MNDIKNFYDKKYSEGAYQIDANQKNKLKKKIELVFNLIKINYSGGIIDIGGGIGNEIEIFNQLFYETVLFDISDVALEIAQNKGIKAIKGDFINYEFQNKYDVVFSKNFSLLNTQDDDKFSRIIKQMYAIVNQNGKLVYWLTTDLSGRELDNWINLNVNFLKKHFDETLIFIAPFYQSYLPIFFNKILTKIFASKYFLIIKKYAFIDKKVVVINIKKKDKN